MRVAEFLSDMTTLSICDPDAALALVSARSSRIGTSTGVDVSGREDSNTDLIRAKDLLHLHGTVKLAHQDGTDKELNEAREAVARVLRDL